MSSTTRFEHNTFGQVTKVTNGNDHETVYSYFASGASKGYLESVTVDPQDLGLTTTYATDARGNVTAVTNPRGVRSEATYNVLDWVTESRAAVTPPDDGPGQPSLSYVTRTFYDRNGNVSEQEIPFGETGIEHTVVRRAYGILDEIVEVSREIQPGGEVATWLYAYDEAFNQIRETDPVGNMTEIAYEERNLAETVTRGLGANPLETPIVEHWVYNGDRERTALIDGLGRSWASELDGFGRPSKNLDPLGNARATEYDANSNVTRVRALNAAGELLAESEMVYDALDRPATSTAWLWTGEGPTGEDATHPSGAAAVTTVTDYDAASNVIRVTDPLGRMTWMAYDGAERLDSTTDPAGNVISLVLDRNGNVTAHTTQEVSSGLGSSGAQITETFTYDALDRQVAMTDGVDNTWTQEPDARGLIRRVTGPEGHSTISEFDGLDRLVTTTQPEGLVVEYGYDPASRLVSYLDAKGNPTAWTYDAADRQTSVTYADGTSETYAYDAAHNLEIRVDANGTTVAQTFDAANRLIARTALPANGYPANGALTESFQYDGLGRMVFGQSGTITTELTYDSLSRLTEEVNAGRRVTYGLDAVGNTTMIGYPSNLIVTQTFGPLNRPLSVETGGVAVTSYGYRGPYLKTQEMLDGQLQGQWNYDLARRQTGHRYFGAGRADQQMETLSWSSRSLKTQSVRVDLGHTGWSYGYDGAQRLRTADWSRFAVGEQGHEAFPATRLWDYSLDTAQNLVEKTRTDRLVTQDEGGTLGWSVYQEQRSLPPDVRNRPTQRDAVTPLTYDANGNVSNRGSDTLSWDFRNRLVEVSLASGARVEYAYDVFNRLVKTTRIDPAGVTTTEETVWAGWRELESYRNGVLHARHVRGAGLDEIARSSYDLDGNGTTETTYYPLYDSAGNLTTLLDDSFKPAVRYRYSPYSELVITEVDEVPARVPQVAVDPELGVLYIEVSEEISKAALDEAYTQGEIRLSEPSSAMGADVKSSTSLELSLAQPVEVGHRARHRFTLAPVQPPAPGTLVTLTIEPPALIDLFANLASEPFTLSFEWPLPPTPPASTLTATKSAASSWLIAHDDTAPSLERVAVIDGYLYVALSEPPNLAGFSQAFTVDGGTIAWTLLDDGYSVRSLDRLPPGPHQLQLSSGIPVDLAGNSVPGPFDVTIEDTSDRWVFNVPDPRRVDWRLLPNRFLLHGRSTDEDTGLVYVRNRWLDPATGRFLSPDPMGYADGPSMYQYALNDPVNLSDPTGEFVISGLIITGAAIYGATEEIERATDIDPHAHLGLAATVGGLRGAGIAGVAVATAGFGGGLAAGLGGGVLTRAAVGGAFAGSGAVLAQDVIDVGVLHRREGFSSLGTYAGTAAFGGVIGYGGARIGGALLARYPWLGSPVSGVARTLAGRTSSSSDTALLRSAALADDPLLDASILTRLSARDPIAVRFAARRRGLLSTTAEIRDEFVGRHGKLEWQRIAGRHDIRLLESASPGEVMNIASRVSAKSINNDLRLLAAAHRHGIGMVTADLKLFGRALRSGLNSPEFRIFEGTSAARIQAIAKARRLVGLHRPGASPHSFTGSARR